MRNGHWHHQLSTLLLASLFLFSCAKTEQSSSSNAPIEGLEVGIVDNDVFDVGESCEYEVTLPSSSSSTWKMKDSKGSVMAEADGFTSSFVIRYTFETYGDYLLNLNVSSAASSFSQDYSLHCLDSSKPTISSMPSDKTIEAGTSYSFADDLSSIVASDNSGSALSRRVVQISKNENTIKNGHSISVYQFAHSGVYRIAVAVADINENTAIGFYSITVKDTKSPVLSGESSYEVYFDSDYNIVFPEITIVEYSPYTISYKAVSLDYPNLEIQNDKLIAPHIGLYSLTYTVDDGINAPSSFKTKMTVKNHEPTFSFENASGTVYEGTPFDLPTPLTGNLSNAVITYSSSEDHVSIAGNSLTADEAGVYAVDCTVSGTYYLGGEKHKEDGSRAFSSSKSVEIEVSPKGVFDMEIHNNKDTVVWNDSDSNIIRFAEGEGSNGSRALEFDTMNIGFNRFAALEKPIPVPDVYDALTVWVKCGGNKPKGYMYVILIDSDGNQSRSDFYIDALVGQYYTIPLTGAKLKNIKKICIANRMGENGESTTDPDSGVVSSIGENRTFYLDDISLVKMPILHVDSSSIAPILVAGSSLDLPKETLENFTGDYSCVISAEHDGTSTELKSYHVDSLLAGEYTFTYKVKAGGASLSASFSISVKENKTAVVLYNDYGLLRAGSSAPLPKAYLIAMGSTSSSDGSYYASYESGPYEKVVSSISPLKKGTYAIKYEIAYGDKQYSDSLSFDVAGDPSSFSFDKVNNGTDGEIEQVYGNSSPTASIKDGKMILGGWWGGCIFTEDLTLANMSELTISLMSEVGLTHTAVIFLDSTHRTTGGGFHSTEDMGIFYDLEANVQETIKIVLPDGITGICGFAVLTKNTEVAVDSLALSAAVSDIPEGKTGIFHQSENVDVTALGSTKLVNNPADDALKVFGEWVCSFSLGEGQVLIPSSATKMSITMKSNQKIPGMFLRLTTEKGIVYDDETTGVDVNTAYSTFDFTLVPAMVDSYLTKVEIWVQDDQKNPGWKVLYISSIIFGGESL